MKRGTSRLVLVLVLALTGPLLAQEFRGRVQGLVADPSGAVIPGGNAVLTNDLTGIAVTRQTNAEGRYLFDYVDPGTYTLTLEVMGFKTSVHKNIIVQQRGDVTVDVKLEVGSHTDMVTITESPIRVEFNTTTRNLTLELKMVQNLPSVTRNPYQLALLDPSVINRGSLIETQPYHHRTANEMDIGGGTKYRNDFVLDGTPLVAGNKLGYTPPMDAVTEYTIQQNSVDAEFGHNAGGVAVVTMRSGTNEVHGSVYYYGRSPGLNAISDRISRIHNQNPYWNEGGTIGFPIIKKKLFFFGVFERIKNTQTVAGAYTLPSALERQGDFSQSKNADGTLRVIYDPLTTRLDPVTNKYIRDPFLGNVIPSARWDALAAHIMASLWNPNRDPDDPSGFNNFKYNQENKFHYYNFSTKVDWNINDRWRMYGRISRIKTNQDSTDFTGGHDPLKLRNVQGSKRNGWNIAGDTVYAFNASTVLDLRAAFYKVEDKRDYPEMNIGDYSSFWSNAWWEPYMAGRPLVYAPYIVVDSTARGLFGVRNFWYQEPEGYSLHGRFSKYLTKHALKSGTEIRWKRGQAARFLFGQFQFIPTQTANTFVSPNTKTGSAWASFLLGAMDPSNSLVQYTPMQVANTEMYAGYFQDDFKVTKKLTLNLGLRYEYEGGYWDPQHRIQQGLDLTDGIPGMQAAIDPKLQALTITSGGKTIPLPTVMAQSTVQNTYIYNGAFHFTSEESPKGISADKWQLMPRVGVAWRLGDKMVIRGGYGRFYTPVSLIMPDRDANGEMPLGAFTPSTSALPDLTGIPQAYFSNPFPQGLTPAYGKAYGRYTQLGDPVTFDQYQQRTPISDRISISVQRELPLRIVADVTYLMNFVSRDQWTTQLNLADPNLSYTYGAALNASVNNPFYNYGTVETFPGALRKTSKVSAGSLLVPYPQYGAILQTATDLRSSRYNTFQVRLQRPFEKGLSFLATYAYSTQKTHMYYDVQDEYNGILTWQDGAYSPPGGTGTSLAYAIDPKHHFNAAAVYALPIGRGKTIGSGMSRILDAVVGGWQLSAIYTYNAGQKLSFGTMVAPATVEKKGKVGASEYWFNVTGFARQPAYTRRNNPWYYDNLMGPGYKNLDTAISKQFKFRESMSLEARIEAYNAYNGMNYANPTVDITKSDFGRTNAQAAGYYGRQLQYSLRFQF